MLPFRARALTECESRCGVQISTQLDAYVTFRTSVWNNTLRRHHQNTWWGNNILGTTVIRRLLSSRAMLLFCKPFILTVCVLDLKTVCLIVFLLASQSEYDEFISSGLYLVVLLHFCEQRFSDVLGAVDAAGVRTHWHTPTGLIHYYYWSCISLLQHYLYHFCILFLVCVRSCLHTLKLKSLLIYTVEMFQCWTVVEYKPWIEKRLPFLTQLFNLVRILHEHMDNLESMFSSSHAYVLVERL